MPRSHRYVPSLSRSASRLCRGGFVLLFATSLSACAEDVGGITIGIGMDPPPCAAAGNPSACRMQRDLNGAYPDPNGRGR
jgi:hypothetical protein